MHDRDHQLENDRNSISVPYLVGKCSFQRNFGFSRNMESDFGFVSDAVGTGNGDFQSVSVLLKMPVYRVDRL